MLLVLGTEVLLVDDRLLVRIVVADLGVDPPKALFRVFDECQRAVCLRVIEGFKMILDVVEQRDRSCGIGIGDNVMFAVDVV